MNRRTFLETLTLVIAAPLSLASAQTTMTVAPEAGLAFRKDAFSAFSEVFVDDWTKTAMKRLKPGDIITLSGQYGGKEFVVTTGGWTVHPAR